MATPLVSICLPNLNTRPYLPPRMEAILAQTNQDWELIVCDSFSTDGSWEYFQEFQGDPRIHLYQVPKHGLYAGWNECLKRARGRYIHMATSDDVEVPTFQENLLKLLEAAPDCPLAYGDFREMDSAGVIDPALPWLRDYLFERPPAPERRPWESQLLHCTSLWAPWVTMNSVIFRRELLEKTGLFRTDLGVVADVVWGCLASLEGDALYTPEVLAYWRRHPGQATPGEVVDSWVSQTLIPPIQRLLTENIARLPAHWLTVPRWREQVQAFRVKEVREYSGFDRETLRANPKRFLGACDWFIRHQPAYFLQQIFTGLPYRHEVFGTCITFGESLEDKTALFQLPPPQPLPLS